MSGLVDKDAFHLADVKLIEPTRMMSLLSVMRRKQSSLPKRTSIEAARQHENARSCYERSPPIIQTSSPVALTQVHEDYLPLRCHVCNVTVLVELYLVPEILLYPPNHFNTYASPK
jgi:hypothetical protein